MADWVTTDNLQLMISWFTYLMSLNYQVYGYHPSDNKFTHFLQGLKLWIATLVVVVGNTWGVNFFYA